MTVSWRSIARRMAALCAACVIVVAIALAAASPASAATASTFPCASINEDGMEGTYRLGCQVLDAGNDKEDTLNEQAAFGLDDWVFASKFEITGAKYETALDALGFTVVVDTDAQDDVEGVVSFSADVWESWSSALVLFKSGSAKQAEKLGAPGNVVMFLLQPGLTSAAYGKSLGDHAVSHVSFYVSTTDPFGSVVDPPVATPLPPSALLLGLGAAALGGLRLRARRRS